MHNQLQELKGNIRVICRVRPFLGSEESEQSDIAYEFPRTVRFLFSSLHPFFHFFLLVLFSPSAFTSHTFSLTPSFLEPPTNDFEE